MAYATIDDMVRRFGSQELIRLTTPAGEDLDGIVATVAYTALDSATALMEGYIGRRYQVPMDLPPPAVTDQCCAIARFYLSTGDGKTTSEEVRTRHEAAVRWLADISLGRVVLDLDEVATGDESFAMALTRDAAPYGQGQLLMADIAIVEPGPLGEIARAIRARLELVFPPSKFVHEWMPARVDREVWQRLTRRASPALIAVGFNTLHQVETTGSLSGLSRWSVYLATKNERGTGDILFGDKLAPGQFAMLQAGAAILHGFTIKGIGSIEVVEAANSFVDDFKDDSLGLSTIELTVTADLALKDVLTGGALTAGDLTGQTITWEFGGDTVADIINTGTS